MWHAIHHETGIEATSNRPRDRWFDARAEVRTRFAQLLHKNHVEESEYTELVWVEPAPAHIAPPSTEVPPEHRAKSCGALAPGAYAVTGGQR